ncbi:DUF1206 domain-containing protein [Zafaria sp. Z1313]|uniref:DUF1206 domain-containing protein n=1 Tax=Zafaria sp. Z1313 TaxID=3423202 RepID=UPI003D3028B6
MDTPSNAADAARRAAGHPWLERAARLGYVANGILHGVIGVLALVLAGGGSADADQSGALQALAQQPFGSALLWAGAAGSLLLGLWNVGEAVFDRGRAVERVKDAATGAVFLVVGTAFGRYALGGRDDSGEAASSVSAELMGHPLGRVALIALGAVLMGMCVYFVYKGVTRKFMEDLRVPGGRKRHLAIEATGAVGYAAKGLVLGALGLLFIVATVQHNPEDATGIDGALKAVRDQSFGVPALAAIGVGLIAYGVYLVFRSRYDTMD